MIYNVIVIIASIVLAIIVEKINYKKEFNIKNKLIILECIILIIGFLIRTVSIQYVPNALNVDEASAGYEAYSILNYGIDRHGNHNPAFLIAWGGGQNVLLTYLIIPFVKVLGLNILSVRLPMAIIGCISLIAMYSLLKNITNKKISIIGLIFFSICPWHIMKSRWGLESNLFPDLILIFVFLLVKGLQDKKKVLYYLSFVIAGISAYSYGTSYFFLPFFIVPVLIILVVKKEITIRRAMFSLILVGVVALPIILCVIINQFDLNQINLPFLTIPKLSIQRYEKISSIFSGSFFTDSIYNFTQSVKIIINQSDNLPWNALETSGLIYKFSLIFTIIGIVVSFSKKVQIKYEYIFNIWFIIAFLLLFICEPNINRINILWIPLIFYTIIGIFYVIKDNTLIEKIVLITYIISFLIFSIEYLTEDSASYYTFEGNIKEVVEYVEKNEDTVESVYVTNLIKEPYIYFLFYEEYNTQDFVNSVKYENEEEEFQIVNSFGKYKFKNIQNIENNNSMYIIKKDRIKDYDIDYVDENIKFFEDYVVIKTNRKDGEI